jgi:hypothetical protein
MIESARVYFFEATHSMHDLSGNVLKSEEQPIPAALSKITRTARGLAASDAVKRAKASYEKKSAKRGKKYHVRTIPHAHDEASTEIADQHMLSGESLSRPTSQPDIVVMHVTSITKSI